MLDISTLFVDISAFSEAFLGTSVLHTLLTVTHIIFILNNLLIINTFWDSSVALMPVGNVEFHVVHKWSLSRFHKESTLRWILCERIFCKRTSQRTLPWKDFTKGCEVPRVLIHLLSHILRRYGSWLRVLGEKNF